MTDRISELAAALATSETERMVAATPRSKALYDRAVHVLPQGVGSSFQAGDPYPLYLERGEGSHVWDVDGNEYLDFHNGFGDRKSTRLNSSHIPLSRMPSSA